MFEELHVTHIAGTFLWRVLAPFRYVNEVYKINVPVGFVTNGASTPRGTWNVFPPTGLYIESAVCHDFLYDTHMIGLIEGGFTELSRKEADELFLQMLKEQGIGWARRRMMYRAVRIGGRRPWADDTVSVYDTRSYSNSN